MNAAGHLIQLPQKYKLHETDKINMFRPVENYKSLKHPL